MTKKQLEKENKLLRSRLEKDITYATINKLLSNEISKIKAENIDLKYQIAKLNEEMAKYCTDFIPVKLYEQAIDSMNQNHFKRIASFTPYVEFYETIKEQYDELCNVSHLDEIEPMCMLNCYLDFFEMLDKSLIEMETE